MLLDVLIFSGYSEDLIISVNFVRFVRSYSARAESLPSFYLWKMLRNQWQGVQNHIQLLKIDLKSFLVTSLLLDLMHIQITARKRYFTFQVVKCSGIQLILFLVWACCVLRSLWRESLWLSLLIKEDIGAKALQSWGIRKREMYLLFVVNS